MLKLLNWPLFIFIRKHQDNPNPPKSPNQHKNNPDLKNSSENLYIIACLLDRTTHLLYIVFPMCALKKDTRDDFFSSKRYSIFASFVNSRLCVTKQIIKSSCTKMHCTYYALLHFWHFDFYAAKLSVLLLNCKLT